MRPVCEAGYWIEYRMSYMFCPLKSQTCISLRMLLRIIKAKVTYPSLISDLTLPNKQRFIHKHEEFLLLPKRNK